MQTRDGKREAKVVFHGDLAQWDVSRPGDLETVLSYLRMVAAPEPSAQESTPATPAEVLTGAEYDLLACVRRTRPGVALTVRDICQIATMNGQLRGRNTVSRTYQRAQRLGVARFVRGRWVTLDLATARPELGRDEQSA